MSNRLLGILIIIGFIGAFYLYYNVKYLPNKNLEYKKQAEIENNLKLEKQKKPEIIKQIINKEKLTSTQKINEIKENKLNYKTIKIDDYRKIIFKQKDNKLDLYFENKKIGTFDLVYPEFLRTELIKSTENDLYIEIGNNKFIYDEGKKSIFKIELNIDLEYVKLGEKNKLIFVTKKGSFIYSKITKKLEYFSFFNDFIFYNDGYIGLIKKKEKRILKNLGLKSNYNSIILYYNPSTKEKKIIYNTNLNIINIYEENSNVYMTNDLGEIFELQNIN